MKDTTYHQEIQVALDKVDKQPERSDEVTLSTGVVLKFGNVPMLRIQAVVEQFPYPEVPKVLNKDKDRYERNPLDAIYIKAKEEVDNRRGMAVVDTILVSGTEIVSIPKGFTPIESEDWVEELKLSHLPVNAESKVARKHAWLKYVAVSDEEDVGKIVEYLGASLGTGEAHVAKQLHNNFQD